jgi:hypothetical protein
MEPTNIQNKEQFAPILLNGSPSLTRDQSTTYNSPSDIIYSEREPKKFNARALHQVIIYTGIKN